MKAVKSKYFAIYELVPKELYELVHEDVLWRMVPEGIITFIDKLKEKFHEGSMTINNYFWGGDRNWSGLRLIGSKYYSKTSRHSSFDAVDIVFSKYDSADVRKYVLDNQDEFTEIGGIEDFDGMTWLHGDIRPRRDSRIIVFRK